MDKKGISTLVIVAIIVIAVVVAGIAVYYVYYSGGDGGNGGNGGEDVYTIQNATSLQYESDVTSGGVTYAYNWAGKNIGTESLMIRLDILGGELGNFSYIMNAGDQLAWKDETGTWEEGNFTELWLAWGTAWTENLDALQANWSGTGDYSYTSSIGDEITISNISLNPELADSLFAPPT